MDESEEKRNLVIELRNDILNYLCEIDAVKFNGVVIFNALIHIATELYIKNCIDKSKEGFLELMCGFYEENKERHTGE